MKKYYLGRRFQYKRLNKRNIFSHNFSRKEKMMFVKGKVYNRQHDLHDIYGGQRQSGISTCARHPIIFLFTSEFGKNYGYRDGWIRNHEGYFQYTGEGQTGEMEYKRGNLAIRDHKQNGKQLHLFQWNAPGEYKYIGEFECEKCGQRPGVDIENKSRQLIVFILKLVN